MAVTANDVDDFLQGPLVKWLSTCVKKPQSLQVYESFFDGTAINEVLLQIDPEPALAAPTVGNISISNVTITRIKVFHNIIRNIKTIYEEELGQVVVNLPDCIILGKTPTSEAALSQLKLLLLLLLGCAVQGPTKEIFIARIKELDVDTQHDIVECIRKVTDEQSVVLVSDWCEHSPQKLFLHIKSLIEDRDKILQHLIAGFNQETSVAAPKSNNDGVESNHWAVELADFKARFRKQRQELEEKTELLTECKEELEHVNSHLLKLKSENKTLLAEARKAKTYQDEIDSIRERAERTERLELEIQRYRERLADAEFYKVRVDELREDNRILMETREMLETQLAKARERADMVLELEAELLSCKQKYNEIILEKDAAKEKIQELVDENEQLQQVTKSALHDISMGSILTDPEIADANSEDNSLCEQLTNNAQARALRLELENKKLLNTIQCLKEEGFHDNVNKILELDKEKKKLLLKCEQLEETCDKLNHQNNELENLFKNAIQENRKLQSSLDNAKVLSERQSQELQNEKSKIAGVEKNIENVSKEKLKVQALFDSAKKRADDAEKCLAAVSEQLQNLQTDVEKGKQAEQVASEMKNNIAILEKENANLQKEVGKLKEAVEAKDVILDQNIEANSNQEKEIGRLNQKLSSMLIQVEKLQNFEQKATELNSQVAINSETIAALQKDLINEKVANEKIKSNLERLGLTFDILDSDLKVITEKLLSNSDVASAISSKFLENDDKTCAKCLSKQEEEVAKSVSAELSQQCNKLTADIALLQSLNGGLQNENATLQVDISTLKSQINSLQAQQCALQLANSQLVAEKEELSKKQQLHTNDRETLLLDQVTLRTLHEQLNTEYEELKIEQESLKKINRDLKFEMRNLKETNDNLQKRIVLIESEKENYKKDVRNLTNLRTEHSKLKDDFRNLFTASERLKLEYRNVQDELKSLRTESRNLRLGNTEMQGELNTTSDKMATLQMDNARLQQKCDMLFEMNHSLDSDRRALMDHVSQLLSQYHSLLTHSLEDKQHYHLEEKLFTDKVNNLCRQKEKLEEKIMEHYRKLDNASSKKKGFGATFVKRVRKAGSDIINKVPNRNRRSWHEDTARLSQSQFTLGLGSGESVDNESDNSVEESFGPANREPVLRNTEDSGSLCSNKSKNDASLRLAHREASSNRNSIAGSVGSRRTVYLSEDDHAPVAMSTPSSAKPNPNASLLVYNRISTVIGDANQLQQQNPLPSHRSSSPHHSTVNVPDVAKDERKKDNSKEAAIWYEYGCV